MASAGGFLLVQQATLDACRSTVASQCSTISRISSLSSSEASCSNVFLLSSQLKGADCKWNPKDDCFLLELGMMDFRI